MINNLGKIHGSLVNGRSSIKIDSSNVDITGNLLTKGIINFSLTNEELASADPSGILSRFDSLDNRLNTLLTSNNDACFNNVDVSGSLNVQGEKVMTVPALDICGNDLSANTTYEITTGPVGNINNISFVKKTIFQASFPSQTSLKVINNRNGNPYILGNNYSSNGAIIENNNNSSPPFLWNVHYDVGPSAQGNNGPLVFTCRRSGYYKINVDGTVRDETSNQPTDFHELFVYHHRGATETVIARSRGGESAPQQGSYYSRQALGMNFIYLLQIGDALDIRVESPLRGGEIYDRFYLENGTITINVVSL